MLPPVSLPSAAMHCLAATAAADPPLDPPGTCLVSHGLKVGCTFTAEYRQHSVCAGPTSLLMPPDDKLANKLRHSNPAIATSLPDTLSFHSCCPCQTRPCLSFPAPQHLQRATAPQLWRHMWARSRAGLCCLRLFAGLVCKDCPAQVAHLCTVKALVRLLC